VFTICTGASRVSPNVSETVSQSSPGWLDANILTETAADASGFFSECLHPHVILYIFGNRGAKMASRLFHGSRPSKQKDKEEESVAKTIRTAKRTSLIPSASAASKIPTHVSMFSRHKAKAAEEKAPAPKQATIQPNRTVEQRSGSIPIAVATGTTTARGRGDFGFGVRTEIFGSTPPTKSSPTPRNRLRRKASSNDQRMRYAGSNASTSIDDSAPATTIETSSSPGGYTDPFPGSILGISLPAVSQSTSQVPAMKSTPTAYATSSSRMANYIQRPPTSKTPVNDLTLPIPHYAARSSSTSTRYSESPGPFSRTSTPTSASSYSPGITQSARLAPRLKTSTSPTRSRPPVTRRKIGVVAPLEAAVEDQGLPPLRESSSSSSTVKLPEGIENLDAGRVGRSGRINAPPPTPPLRLSSKRTPKPRGVAQGSSADEKDRSAPRGRQAEATQRPSVAGSRIPASSTSRSRIPPPRPSREGTPRLENEMISPVIQSNLSHLETTGHKRRESVEKALLTSPSKSDDRGMKALLQRSPSNASTSSKRPQTSPGPARPQSPHLYSWSKSQSREQLPLQTANLKQHPSKAATPVSESPSKSPSRFGLFNRRIKSPAEVSNATTERPIKKGPAAGTGHEGYGKYARRGRSGSISTTASRGRSTSTDRTSISYRPSSSRKSSFASDDKPELDDFYRNRLEPVVIGGGGAIRENRNSQTHLYRPSSGESSASLTSAVSFGPPLTTRRQLQTGTASSGEDSLPSSHGDLMPPPRFGMPSRSQSSDSSSTLAHRRSLHRSQLREAEPLKIPAPINTQALDSSAVLDSFDTMRSSIAKTDSSLDLTDDLSEGHEGNWLRPKKPQQRVKLPKKWNLFQRAQNSPGKDASPDSPQRMEGSKELPASISKMPQSRFVPHYAMMDNSEPEDTDTLEDILHDIEDDLDLRNPENATGAGQDMPQREREYSMLLPSPPRFSTGFTQLQRPSPPVVNLDQRMPIVEPTMPQTSPVPGKRLQQVGRIPKVVSKRDRLHRPPPQSFSRPFVRNPDHIISPIASEPAPESRPLMDQPIRAVQTEPLPSGPWTRNPFDEPARPLPSNGMLYNLDGEKEFLSLSPRQNSDVSGSGSSGVLSLAGMTAQMPRPNSLLKEDEVWNEYDELLDRVASPESTEISWPGKDDIVNSFPTADVSQQLPGERRKKESPVFLSPRSSDSTALASSPPKRQPKNGRSGSLEPLELSSPQRSDLVPSTPMSFSDIYAGYGDRSSLGVTNRQSASSGSRYSSQSVVSRSGSRTSQDGDSIRRYTKVMADKINDAVGTSNSLRYSALMTARWLCFDRVLFSPVQDEIRNSRQDKVLVLDGLANDDWSSYCALTYPGATVYNLSTPRPLSTSKRDTENWQPPPNHRQIHHSSMAHPFPFPKGFFTAVVLRFPVATSESCLRSAVSECKRVLRPGGYLELCILDMDMVNMGNRARRAVRGLKTKMQVADPSISLSPTSDTVQKMLGRRGFENLSRCVVGVPVAGVMTEHGSESPDEKHTSLGEMLRNPTAGGSVPVTKMIAKVGRWWWSRCYERSDAADGDADASIWADRALLRECENRDTGFRLVICYAQKPLNVRRRTVSL